MYLNSPIEQFLLVPFFICSGISNLSLFYVIIGLIFIYLSIFTIYSKFYKIYSYYIVQKSYLFLFQSFKFINSSKKIKFNDSIVLLSFIPTAGQFLVENLIIEFINSFKNLVNSNTLFPFFYTIITTIFFILTSNLIGLIPFTFTITAQIFITINLALLVFISFNVMGIFKHGINLIQIIIPSGVHMVLHFLLIPIEVISYIFKPISLAIRLFANIMAGHTLLKVICGFIFKAFKLDLNIIFNILPFFIISILFGLECFVALIQSYVFFILVCLFLKDILGLNH